MAMKNLTLSIQEDSLQAARKFAKSQGTTVNQLVRDFLDGHFQPDRQAATQEMLRVLRAHPGNSQGWKWNRADAYDR